jgi:hypothetical protein
VTLSAIQRNFESLSNICKNEKQNNIELQKKINFLQEENNILNSNILSLQEKYEYLFPSSLSFFFLDLMD